MSCLLGETKPQIISNISITGATTSTNSTTTTSTTSSASATTTSSSSTTTASQASNNKLNNNSLNNFNQNNIGTHNNNNNSTSINSQETCLICGDVASGKHYGLRSCEACKAFFKRTVQGKIEYSCPAARDCEINKRRRKACQACRFQKCLNMGMLKEGVRLDRVRGGRQKYRRSPGLNGGSNALGGVGPNGGSTNGPNQNSAINQNNSGAGQNLNGSADNLAASGSGVAGSKMAGVSMTAASVSDLSETNRIMTALINCEPEELSAAPGQYVASIPSSLSIQMKTLYILSDLFDRELVSLIGWAKQIPGFSETITLNDQMRLLQSTWAEVIALSIGYRSHLKRIENHKQLHENGTGTTSNHHHHHQQQHHHHHHHQHILNATPSPTSSSPASSASGYNNNNHSNSNYNPLYNPENSEIRLVFAKDLIIDFKHAVACGAEEIFYNCVQLIKRLDYLRITPKEYILLKAISLTNADVRLENPKATHQLRDLVMDTLYEATLSDCLNMNTSTNNNSSSNSGSNASLSPMSHKLSPADGSGKTSTSSLSTQASSNNNTNHHQIKIEAQDRPLSSINQHASTSSPPRPSSSVPSSSSMSSTSISPQNNNSSGSGNLTNNSTLDNITLANRKSLVNQRLNQVLLCLPVLRQIDSCIRRFWNDVRKGPNTVPMNKLFEEMLEPCQRVYRSSAEM